MSAQDRPEAAATLASATRISVVLRTALAAVGTALAVGALELTAILREQPYGLIPFVTSIALVMALPDAEPSRVRALLGGHVVSALVGYAVILTVGSSPVAAALATGLSVAAMLSTRTMHPPAAINPFLIVNDAPGWSFLFETVLPGAVLLGGFAWCWHRIPDWVARLRSSPPGSRAGTRADRAAEPPPRDA